MLRPKKLFGRYFKGGTKKRDRPTLFLELFFDVVVAVVLGGISSKTTLWLSVLEPGGIHERGVTEELAQLMVDSAPRLISFYSLELITSLLIWRAVTHHMLRYRDSIHLRIGVLAIMVPFLLTAASSYLASTPSEFSDANFEFFIRFNVYAYSATALIVAVIYGLHALSTRKIERRYNLLFGMPFLVSGVVIIPLVSGILTRFAVYDKEFWNSLLVIMGVQVLVILLAQRVAGRKRFNSFDQMRVENLKDRYNSLFLLFMGEFVITIIDGWVRGGPEKGENIAILVLSFFLPLVTWWRYTNYLDYLDMRRTHNSMLSFATMMLLSICFLLFVADGLAMWMEGAKAIGTKVFAFCSLGSLIASSFLWNSFKRYKESTRFVMPKWAIAAGSLALVVSDAISITLVFVLPGNIIANEVCILAGCGVYVLLNSVVFYRNTNHPMSAAEFEKVKRQFHYVEEHSLMD